MRKFLVNSLFIILSLAAVAVPVMGGYVLMYHPQEWGEHWTAPSNDSALQWVGDFTHGDPVSLGGRTLQASQKQLASFRGMGLVVIFGVIGMVVAVNVWGKNPLFILILPGVVIIYNMLSLWS